MKISTRDDNIALGANIRKARKMRKLSLEQLAGETGLSAGFISQLERGIVNASVDNLRKIARALDLRMVDLFEVDEKQNFGVITRKGDGVILSIENSNAYCESLILESGTNIQATIYINPPQDGRAVPNVHNGEEFVYMIKGEALYTLNDQQYHLHEGDSMYYRSEAPHTWVNPGDEESIMIIFNSPPFW